MKIPIRAFRPLTADEMFRLRTVGGNPPADSTSHCRHCSEPVVLGINGWTHLVGPRPHDAAPVVAVVVL